MSESDSGRDPDPASAAADYAFRQRRLRDMRGSVPGRPERALFIAAVFAATVALMVFGVREVNRRSTPFVEPTPRPTSAPIPPPALADVAESQQVVRPAGLRTLHTCVSDAGEKLITDQPCPAGYATTSARDFVPEREPARRRVPSDTSGPSASPTFGTPAPDRESEQARRRCEAAKAYEADYRERRGLKITYDELSGLSDRVRRACADA